MWLNFWPISFYIFNLRLSGNNLLYKENICIYRQKEGENVVKPKMGISIFFKSFIFIITLS